MIEKVKIESLVNDHISGTGIFIVNITISTGNKITILADKRDGITISECVGISRQVEGNLDREEEDFELQVSSPGLGEPFLVKEQFEMNVGRKVAVVDNQGKRHVGILKMFTGNSFDLEITKKMKGRKKEIVEKPFNIEEINKVL